MEGLLVDIRKCKTEFDGQIQLAEHERVSVHWHSNNWHPKHRHALHKICTEAFASDELSTAHRVDFFIDTHQTNSRDREPNATARALRTICDCAAP